MLIFKIVTLMLLQNFYLMSVILTAIAIFITSKPLYSLLYFLLFTVFTGILYINLGFELIGIIQILLYGGAIVVFLLFMVSFLRLPKYQINLINFLKFTIFISLWIYVGSIFFKKIPPVRIKFIPISTDLVPDLFGYYTLVFELISLLFILIPIFFYFAKKENGS